ncbi:MAG: hypothetical protein RLZZ397_795 [Pseudomonadota bacterium]
MNQVASTNIYQAIGGEAAVRQLATRFYEIMDELPEAYALRQIHPESLEGSTQTLFEFLSGWLGGPSLYQAKHGHPRLRMRHFPYSIDQDKRNEWMLCMRLALNEVVQDEGLRMALHQAFSQMADHMINASPVVAGAVKA